MLLKNQIQELAQTHPSKNAGYVEKQYLQDLILHSIYTHTADQLVFKGGTALQKIYNLDRFSEDLDFTENKKTQTDHLINKTKKHLQNYGIPTQKTQTRKTKQSHNTRLGLQGPLYTQDPKTLSYIRIEINTESQAEKPVAKRYTPIFPDIPSFTLTTLPQEEILAEKIRALITRNQAKDLYDIYHLLHKNIKIDKKLVNKKLNYYHIEYKPQEIIEKARQKQKHWPNIRHLVYTQPPEFNQVIETLKKNIPE